MDITRNSVVSTLGQRYAQGARLDELAAALEVPKGNRQKLRKLLNELIKDGLIERKNGQYSLADRTAAGAAQQPHAIGQIRVHPAGYGFVEREDGLGDVFVPAKYRGRALDGDRVRLYTWEGYRGTEGRVEEVLARGRAKLTGVVVRSGRSFVLEPDDPRIATDYGRVLLEEGAVAAAVDQCAVVEITRYPTDLDPTMAGRVLRVLGPPEDPNTEIEKIIACEDIPVEFPDEARAQAEATSQEVGGRDLADRIDLRDRAFITIDPETARDFDDALCIEPGPGGGTRVWVAVADVSHYVHPDDALDRESQVRGVSVYLPDRVIPMLPFELSSGICSLNPDVDRCAMVARLDYSARGELRDTGFAAAVIRSQARLDYPGVAAALSGDFRGQRARYRKWAPALAHLDELAQTLRQRRRQRGTLELEIPEPKVVLDADDPRLVRDIVQAKGSEGVKGAYELVEEFMIAANEAVGAFFARRGITTVWRVHAPPEEDRIEELGEILGSFGIHVDVAEAMTPLGMRDVLAKIEGKPLAQSLSFLVLRSLTQALYDTTNVGHFGLASTEYLHFTSPIRRYPDILVHRLLKYHLRREGQASGGAGHLTPPSDEGLAELAAASSSHERRAIEAEREAVAMYRAYLMREHVGEVFSGRVSAVTSFGVFVEIPAPFVEGLIKLDTLGDDFFDFEPTRVELVGRRTGRRIRLGDPVDVEVINASITRRQVELRLVRHAELDPSERTGSRGRSGRDGRVRNGERRDGKSRRAAPAREERPRRHRDERDARPPRRDRRGKKGAGRPERSDRPRRKRRR